MMNPVRWMAVSVLGGVALAALLAGCPSISAPLQIPVDLGTLTVNPGGDLSDKGRAQGYVYVPSSIRQAAQPQISDNPQPPTDFVPAVGATVTLVSVGAAEAGALQQQTTVTNENGYFFFDGLDIDVTVTVTVTDQGGQVLSPLANVQIQTIAFATRGFKVVRVDLSMVDQYRNNIGEIRSYDSVRMSADITNGGAASVQLRIFSSARGDLTSATAATSPDADLQYDISVEPGATRSIRDLEALNVPAIQEVGGPNDPDRQFFLYMVTQPGDIPVTVANLKLNVNATLGISL